MSAKDVILHPGLYSGIVGIGIIAGFIWYFLKIHRGDMR